MEKPLRVFCCYSRKDQKYLYELKNHLMGLQREKLIEIQADIDISPGTEWESKINHHLKKAQIILLLVSPDFLASEYCYEKEMCQAIAQHEQGISRVVPVIIRPAAWKNTPFGKLQALPKDAKAVIRWQNKDEVWTDVAEGMRRVIAELLATESQGRARLIRQPVVSRRAFIIGVVGSAVIAASGSGVLVLTHQARTGVPRVIYRGHTDVVRFVAWSPDSKRIASASHDKTVQVWNASDGNNVFVYTKHTQFVEAAVWSPDGKRIASCSDDKTVQVWNASDGSHAFAYTRHFNDVPQVAWSPDGQRIASASLDHTVQVWNASDGSHVFTYTGHTNRVWSVAWSRDGKWIASSSADKTVHVWSAP